MGPRERGRELVYMGGQLWLLSKEVLKDMGPHGFRDSKDEALQGQPQRSSQWKQQKAKENEETQDEDSTHQLWE